MCRDAVDGMGPAEDKAPLAYKTNDDVEASCSESAH